MAEELTLTATMQFAKANFSALARNLASNLKRDVAGTKLIGNVQAIGNSAEPLALGDLGTLGYIICKNLDATNSISIRMGVGGANVVKLKPGDVALFRFDSNTPHGISSAGTPELEYYLVED